MMAIKHVTLVRVQQTLRVYEKDEEMMNVGPLAVGTDVFDVAEKLCAQGWWLIVFRLPEKVAGFDMTGQGVLCDAFVYGCLVAGMTRYWLDDGVSVASPEVAFVKVTNRLSKAQADKIQGGG
jgi:hypothetical protein